MTTTATSTSCSPASQPTRAAPSSTRAAADVLDLGHPAGPVLLERAGDRRGVPGLTLRDLDSRGRGGGRSPRSIRAWTSRTEPVRYGSGIELQPPAERPCGARGVRPS